MSQGYGSIETGRQQELQVGAEDSAPARPTLRLPSGPHTAIAAVLVIILGYLVAFPLRGHLEPADTKTSLDKHPHHHNVSDPTRAFFYRDQTVDHQDPDNSGTFAQRYYESLDYFQGPGSPIFVILGGEDALEKILYPFVSQHLAKRFGAYTMCIEHRFYGKSIPVSNHSNADLRHLLTFEQALLDFVQMIRYKQQVFGCGPRGSPTYCPVVSVGGSYPGFLSALLRITYPDTVDIGYASSAPLHLYSHSVDQGAYYEKVTSVAESASPGCKHAVKDALMKGQRHLLSHSKSSVSDHAAEFGLCVDKIPDYIENNTILSQEIMMIVANHFAENNMDYYPPSPDRELVQGCQIFQNEALTFVKKIVAFLAMRNDKDCFDLTTEQPPGGTISASDWSGVGGGHSGYMWDFQSCYLIPECGMSNDSMFPPRPWTLEWLTHHCQARFGATPDPSALVNKYDFENLSHHSRILFTNGIQDGWSVASIVNNVSDDVVAVNMVNGAHHSDLTHQGPSDKDTDDVKEAFEKIERIIGRWLSELKEENR